jgi:all-trans-nonaprenyl-diphosphate synthase
VIKDFAEGEIQQGLNRFDTSLNLETYLEKSYYKTASLIANSAKAAAVLSESAPEVGDRLYDYGRNLGLAFQIVDDILDFTASTEVLGKPAGSDLIGGHVTAPALYAMEEHPILTQLIDREFAEEGDEEKALELVRSSQGIIRAKELAAHHGRLALESLVCLEPSPSKDALTELIDYVLSRMY